MAHTKINTQVIPDGTIVSADLSMPITGFSSTGIDDNASSTAITIDSSQNVVVGGTAVDVSSSVSLKNEGSIRSVFASGVGGDSLFGAISGVSNGYQIVADSSNNQTYKWHNGATASMTLNSSGNLVGAVWSDNGTANPNAKFVKLTQAEYDAITPDANTIYFIV